MKSFLSRLLFLILTDHAVSFVPSNLRYSHADVRASSETHSSLLSIRTSLGLSAASEGDSTEEDERIDLGAVSGKFVAREYPDWQESASSPLKHDAPGIVSVRRGNDSGFGFTIYPGNNAAATSSSSSYLDDEHIVIGRVLEGMDVVQALNEVPVIASSKVNYMSLTGGTTTKNAPTRSCRYGGPMYCNENKPLVKLSITETGILR